MRQYKAFQGANGWYVALEDTDGYHRQPQFGDTLTKLEAKREARERNAGSASMGDDE